MKTILKKKGREVTRMSELEKREEEEDEDFALPGFRFHPTDEELVGFYLPRKVENKRFSIDIIKQVDIYKFDPWDLAKQSIIGIGENEWYFFCLRERKYRNSVRPNRVTESGYWKATGIDKKIIFPLGTNNCIGLKKSLVYYCGKGGKGTNTYWMMHEFRLSPKRDECSKDLKSSEAHEAENWTICKIFKRNASPAKESASHSRIAIDHTNPNSYLVDSKEIGGEIYGHTFEPSVAQPHEEKQVIHIDWQEEQVLDNTEEHWNDINFAENSEFDFDRMNWDELGSMFEIDATPIYL